MYVPTRIQLIEVAQKMNSEILESIKETTAVSTVMTTHCDITHYTK